MDAPRPHSSSAVDKPNAFGSSHCLTHCVKQWHTGGVFALLAARHCLTHCVKQWHTAGVAKLRRKTGILNLGSQI